MAVLVLAVVPLLGQVLLPDPLRYWRGYTGAGREGGGWSDTHRRKWSVLPHSLGTGGTVQGVVIV